LFRFCFHDKAAGGLSGQPVILKASLQQFMKPDRQKEKKRDRRKTERNVIDRLTARKTERNVID
jgi:hypothetical protein